MNASSTNGWMTKALAAGMLLAVMALAFLYMSREALKTEKRAMQSQLEASRRSEEKLEGDLGGLHQTIGTLEERLASQDRQSQELQSRLSEQLKLREKAEAEVARKDAEIARLREQIAQLEEERRDLMHRLEKQYADYADIKSQLSSILKTKEELEAKAKELAENGPISLGTVVIRQN